MTVEVSPTRTGWVVYHENSTVTYKFEKSDAIRVARAVAADHGERVVIHNADRSVRGSQGWDYSASGAGGVGARGD